MSEPQLHDGWLEVDAFCAKYKQSKNTIHKRVHDGVWARGEIYASPSGGVAYVHVERALKWLEVRGKLKL